MGRQQRALLLHGGYIGGHTTGYYAGGTGASAITGEGMDIGNYGASFAEVWCKGDQPVGHFPYPQYFVVGGESTRPGRLPKAEGSLVQFSPNALEPWHTVKM